MVAQSLFSHKKMQNKNCNELQEMMFVENNVNWNSYPTQCKRGCCIVKETYTSEHANATRTRWIADYDTPIFTTERDYIDMFVNV